MYIKLVMLSTHLILCHPLVLLPSTFPSIRVGSYHQVAKELERQLQRQSSNEYSGLISFTIDLFDLLAVRGTLKSLSQDHNGKTMETVTDLFSWAPKSLWIVTAAMKLKDACSLQEKL